LDVSARDQPDELFLYVAERLKQPLLHIAHATERMEDEARTSEYRRDIATSTQAAIQLIDGYLLSAESSRQGQLPLEPISLGSVLYDAAENLEGYAKQHGCELRLEIGGRHGLVMAHRRLLKAALIALSMSFIDASQHEEASAPIITLSARRASSGVSVGVYTNGVGISQALLKHVRSLHVRVRQPLVDFESGNGAGIFIADTLFSRMGVHMRASHAGQRSGIISTFTPSSQLSLV
jgi:light-regulated signal transduction histidine kinase (bacteriophytochrome)